MSIVPIIVAIEEEYKKYLFACKQIKIDPSIKYEQEVIDKKVDDLLSDAGLNKKDAKKLVWFKKNYGKMEGGALGNKYISRAKKEMSKGKLALDYEIAE